MRITLHDESQSNPEAAVALANEIYSSDLLQPLLTFIPKYEFEVRLLYGILLTIFIGEEGFYPDLQ
jgi:hypothetical protein